MNEGINTYGVLTNMIIGNGNIASLPEFIGNYLLTLLSEFFPILAILASIVMIYQTAANGNTDFKSAFRSLAPNGAMMLAIIAILNMNTPMEKGDEYKGTAFEGMKSYALVELLAGTANIGGVLADNLTHKMLYGTTNVTGDYSPPMNGYFPSALALMKKQNVDNEKVEDQMLGSHLKKINEAIKEFSDDTEASNADMAKTMGVLRVIGAIDKLNNPYIDLSKTGVKKTNNYLFSDSHYIKYNNGEYALTDQIDSKYSALQSKINLTNKNTANDIVKALSEVNGISNYKRVSEPLAALKLDKPFNKEHFFKAYPEAFIKYLSDDYEIDKSMVNMLELNLSKYIKLHKTFEDTKKFIVINYLKDLYTGNLSVTQAKDLEKATKLGASMYGTLDTKIKNIKNYIHNQAIIYQSLAGAEYLNYNLNTTLMADLEKQFGIDGTTNIYQFHNGKQNTPYTFKNSNGINQENRNKLYEVIDDVYSDRVRNTLNIYRLFQDSMKEGFLLDRSFDTTNKDFIVKHPFFNYFAGDKYKNDYNKIDHNYLSGADKGDLINYLEDEVSKDKKDSFSKLIHWTELGRYYAIFKKTFNNDVNEIMIIQQAQMTSNAEAGLLKDFLEKSEVSKGQDTLLNTAGIVGIAEGVVKGVKTKSAVGGSFTALWEMVKNVGGVYFAIYMVNIVIPAFIWMFVIISYYVEVALFIAIAPIATIFLIFQSYRASGVKLISTLLSIVLFPLVLVTIYFTVLFFDLSLPLIFQEFIPFFSSSEQILATFDTAFGGTNNMFSSTARGFLNTFEGISHSILDQAGYIIYAILSMMMSLLLLMTFLKANEFTAKILQVTAVGGDMFNSQSMMNKMHMMDKSGISKGMLS